MAFGTIVLPFGKIEDAAYAIELFSNTFNPKLTYRYFLGIPISSSIHKSERCHARIVVEQTPVLEIYDPLEKTRATYQRHCLLLPFHGSLSSSKVPLENMVKVVGMTPAEIEYRINLGRSITQIQNHFPERWPYYNGSLLFRWQLRSWDKTLQPSWL